MKRAPSTAVVAALAALLALGALRPAVALAQTAAADGAPRVYVVQQGDTILRVAGRLDVPPRDLAARNGIPRPYRLRVGQRLRLPEGVSPEVLRTLPTREQATNGGGPAGAHRAGFVTLVRARDQGEISTNFANNTPALRTRVERFLRARDNRQHVAHPRLIRALQLFSDHFGGRRMTVLSGFRPARAGTPTSRHALGQAVDLRVDDTPLRAVWEFCQTLPDMGCGLFARSNYVHVDVRTAPEAWQGNARRRGESSGRTLDPDPDEDPSDVLADAEPAQAPAAR